MAGKLPQKDVDTLASLAGTWKGIDDNKARELYRQAFEIDPSDPYPLVNYLDCEVVFQHSTALIPVLAPMINMAMQRSRDQADVGLNLPWAFYNIGKLSLLLKKPYESFAAYTKAVQLTTAMFMIESSLNSLEKLSVVDEGVPGCAWVRRLLLLGLVAKFGTQAGNKSWEKVKKMASGNREPIQGPVVIVAGGCEASVEDKMREYGGLLTEAFQGFNGTIISGGTTSGVNGIVGRIQREYGDEVRAIGYLPAELPTDTEADKRYLELRRCPDTKDLTPMEPLQYWMDIIASGIDPAQVKVLGVNGGKIAAVEYRMALAFGATVGIVEESGREAAKLLADHDWNTLTRLLPVPNDPMTAHAFVGWEMSRLAECTREALALAIHKEYQSNQARIQLRKDPSIAVWEELDESLKDSNRQQADDILAKVRKINCEVEEVKDRDVALMTFTKEEIEILAEMEHARWNVERLRNGWRLGDEKSIEKKITPYLVSWQSLPENVREWDRQAVRAIPELLAQVSLEVRRRK